MLVDSSRLSLLVDSSVILVDSSIILPEGISLGFVSAKTRSNLVVRFLICVKRYQSFSYFLMMARDDNKLQSLSTKMGAAERKVDAIKSTLNGMVQELKRLYLKIDDRNLTDGT